MNQVKLAVETAQQENRELEEQENSLRGRLEGSEEEELRVLEFARKGYLDEKQMLQQLNAVRAERRELEAGRQSLHRKAVDIDKVQLLEELVRGQLFAGLRQGLLPEVDDARIDRSLKRVAGFPPTVKMPVDSDRDDGAFELVDLTIEEGWRKAIEALVEKIWVEDDGSITIEGVLPIDQGQPDGISDSIRLRRAEDGRGQGRALGPAQEAPRRDACEDRGAGRVNGHLCGTLQRPFDGLSEGSESDKFNIGMSDRTNDRSQR